MAMDWATAAYVSVLVLLLLIVILLIVALAESLSMKTPKSEYHLTQIRNARTDRNGQDKISYIIYYRFSSLDPDKSPDQSQIQETLQSYLLSTPEIPSTTSWGEVNRMMVDEIYHENNINGISVQLIYDEDTQSSIFTKGYIEPLKAVV
jgi:hypothetical protein